MICFQCGHQVPTSVQSCSNCGQVFGETRKISRTVTSFKALELRKSRLDSMRNENFLSADDCVDGRYDIQMIVGQGPLGQVYKARDRETGRATGLKAIDPKFYENASDRARLLEVLDAASRHAATRVLRPQAVTHGDLIISQSMLVTGVSLAKLIRQRRGKGDALNVTECYPRMTQLHEAIAELYADEAHGLLKPENVLLLADGIRVTDYGLAQGLPREALVEAQREAGTLAYLAPEVRNGDPITVSADVYSLGAIFAEMVSNLPWSDQLAGDERFSARMQEITNAAQLVAFVEKATAEDPAQRFQTVPAFGAALAEISREVVDVPPQQEARSVAPPSTVLLTIQDMPVVQPSPATDTTEELDRLDTYDSFEDSVSEEPSVVEYIISGTGEIISGEAEFLDRVPTKVEARHGTTEPSASIRTPTGVIRERDHRGLGSNRLFFPLLAAIVAIGVGGIWGLLEYFESTQGQSEISVTRPDVPKTSDASAVAGKADEGTQVAVATDKVVADEQVEDKKAVPSQGKPPSDKSETRAKAEKPTEDAPKVREKDTSSVKADTTSPKAKVSETGVKPTPKVEPVAVKTPATKPPTKTVVKRAPPKKPEQTRVKETVKPKTEKPKGNAPSLSCPGGMRLVALKSFPRGSLRRGRISGDKAVKIAREGGAFCIDGYEYPGRGKIPRTSVTRTTAQALCERTGGKRLCTGKEWRRACIGRGGSKYPYGGRSFDPAKCVTEDGEGEERTIRGAGSFRRCRSASGAFDMVGNAGEWTADGRVRGGDVAASDEDASCSASERRSPGFAGSQVGFRCCTDFVESL